MVRWQFFSYLQKLARQFAVVCPTRRAFSRLGGVSPPHTPPGVSALAESEIATRLPEADSQDSDNVNNDSSVYKIEKILKTRVKKGQKEYLVKWLGYPSEQNSWVPESDMVIPESTPPPPINAMQFTSQRLLISKPSTGLTGKPSWSKSCVSPLHSFSSYVYCFVGLLLFMIFCFSCVILNICKSYVRSSWERSS